MILFVRLEKLPALAVIFEHDLLIPLLDHRQIVDVLRAASRVLTDKIDHLKRIVRLVLRQLAPAHHHAGKAVPRPAVELPLHHDERRLAGRKITVKRSVLGVSVALMHKRGSHHLHQHGLSAAVLQRHQRAPALHLERVVADAHGIVVVIEIDKSHRVYFTHTISPWITFRMRW